MNTVICNSIKNTKLGEDGFYRVMLVFIYKYVKFIVDQGAAIVSNLEHLKFFFLSNTNNIDSYNHKAKALGTKTVLPYLYNYNTFNKDGNYNAIMVGGAKNPAAVPQYKTITENILDNPIYYTKDTPITKEITLKEKINIGEMKKYKLLSILQKLANQNPDLEALKPTTTENDKNQIDLFKKSTTQADEKTKEKSLFVMFSNIKIFTDKADNDNKDFANASAKNTICTAEFDTLEFAQSISSTTQGTTPATTTGGAIKHYRKFNLKDLLPKHNIYRRTKKVKSIKRINHTRPQRTKKNE